MKFYRLLFNILLLLSISSRAEIARDMTATSSCEEADALNNAGRYEKAIEKYDRAIKYKLDFAHAYNNKGLALANLGRDEEALEAYDLAIKYKPDYAIAYVNKGASLYKLGRFHEALQVLDKGNDIAFKEGLQIYDKEVAIVMKEALQILDKHKKITDVVIEATLKEAEM